MSQGEQGLSHGEQGQGHGEQGLSHGEQGQGHGEQGRDHGEQVDREWSGGIRFKDLSGKILQNTAPRDKSVPTL